MSVLGPERVDELVAAHWPVAVQHEIGEQQPALPPWQRSVQALSVDLDEETPTQLDPRQRRLHSRLHDKATGRPQRPRNGTATPLADLAPNSDPEEQPWQSPSTAAPSFGPSAPSRAATSYRPPTRATTRHAPRGTSPRTSVPPPSSSPRTSPTWPSRWPTPARPGCA